MSKVTGVEKTATRIAGFDHISAGGLPQGRTTLICGSAGSGKTVFGAQFLAEGILKANERGVLVTFEENPEAIRKNVLGFEWDVAGWEAEKKWLFVDASPKPFESVVEAGDYDLQGLLVRIERAVKQISAKRVCLDSVGAI